MESDTFVYPCFLAEAWHEKSPGCILLAVSLASRIAVLEDIIGLGQACVVLVLQGLIELIIHLNPSVAHLPCAVLSVPQANFSFLEVDVLSPCPSEDL